MLSALSKESFTLTLQRKPTLKLNVHERKSIYDPGNKLAQNCTIKEWLKIFHICILRSYSACKPLYNNHFFISVWEYRGFHLFMHVDHVQLKEDSLIFLLYFPTTEDPVIKDYILNNWWRLTGKQYLSCWCDLRSERRSDEFKCSSEWIGPLPSLSNRFMCTWFSHTQYLQELPFNVKLQYIRDLSLYTSISSISTSIDRYK